ncbi:VapC toxin protein [Granulicella sibirica]|uniref:VapC toxin protein n=2 Tax=Granulicella sibirica TaxID=2479048 RepID=A0A4Q0T996_9BACT|nr:PIN domain-containing protein [Granulicella sibirica]RXH58619.1 VapC toxin protein [Granulicella sibirica]
MYLLDTDLLSQATKDTPNERAMAWLAGVPRQMTRLSVVSLQEIQTGIDILVQGPKRRGLELWFAEKVLAGFAGRIYSIDIEIARDCGHLLADSRKASHTAHLGDALIAATARVHGLSLATLNRKHFAHFDVDLADF